MRKEIEMVKYKSFRDSRMSFKGPGVNLILG